jgi:hypothetical protein
LISSGLEYSFGIDRISLNNGSGEKIKQEKVEATKESPKSAELADSESWDLLKRPSSGAMNQESLGTNL